MRSGRRFARPAAATNLAAAASVVLGTLLIAPTSSGYTPDEETRIVGSVPARLAAPGLLAATARSLAVLRREIEAQPVRDALCRLAGAGRLPDAAASHRARESRDASGPWRLVERVLFVPATVAAATPFYVYDPVAGLYALGGVVPAGLAIEALARRVDGVLVCSRSDGRVLFVDARQVRLAGSAAAASQPLRRPLPPPPPAAAESATELPAAAPPHLAYTYRIVHEGRARLHVVRTDARWMPLTAAASPFYDGLNPGTQRVMGVEDLARRAAAPIAINGTFFIDRSTHPQYGFPIGSLMIGGEVAWNLGLGDLLALDRSYVALTDRGRVVLGNSVLSGHEIRRRNLAGTFDPHLFGAERIRTLMTGFGWLVKDHDPEAWRAWAGHQFDPSFYSRASRRARSLLGVEADGHHLVLVAQEEGPVSPVPMSLPELATFVAARTRVRDLVFLDGGGSTQLVVEGRTVTRPSGGAYRKNSTVLGLRAGEAGARRPVPLGD
jgi:hypothetical protein